jgi:lipopolysaccharide export system permease protein
MNIINKHIVTSVLKVFIATLFLCILLILSVDLFTNLDSYIQYDVGIFNILKITLLYTPEAAMLVLPPSILFSVTFFLSQLFANNEMISLLSAGISYKKVISPIIIVGIFIVIVFFFISDGLSLNSKVDRESMKNNLFNSNDMALNNSNITMRDDEDNYVIYASFYREDQKKLVDVILVKQDENGKLLYRMDSPNAFWNEENKDWIFKDVVISNIAGDNSEITQELKSTFEDKLIDLDPNLFRNLSNDINTLELNSAFNYLKQLKKYDIASWYINCTEFYDRLFSAFTAFVMVTIAISINYKGKKNIFLFAIFNSIFIAVIYYVSKMLFQIVCRQGVMHPIYSVLLPYAIVLIFTLLSNISSKRAL